MMQRLKPLNDFIFPYGIPSVGRHPQGQPSTDALLKELVDMDAAIYKASEKMTFLAND